MGNECGVLSICAKELEHLNENGLGIYEVADGGVSYWLIAVSQKEAIKKIKAHLVEVDGLEGDEEFYATKLPLDKEVTFCADRKAIRHTVEDWIVIYDGFDCGPYLACSEY